jgi:predicted DNA-binding transcriptional regulator YafY
MHAESAVFPFQKLARQFLCKMKRRRDGSLEMQFETTGWKELVRWILSWQPDVKVLSPKRLRERIELKMRQGLARKQYLES